jgi:hypothetical protein
MATPRTIVKLDGRARIAHHCVWHAREVGTNNAEATLREASEWADTNGMTLISGVCPSCITKFKANSLKGTTCEITL